MNKDYVLRQLCIYDKRNPEFYDMFLDLDDRDIIPRNNCYCDNCFRGLDKLAVYTLELLEELERIQNV